MVHLNSRRISKLKVEHMQESLEECLDIILRMLGIQIGPLGVYIYTSVSSMNGEY